MLASCESVEQVKKARLMGYGAAALIVRDFPSKVEDRYGLKLIPCQHTLRGTLCSSCRYCLREEWLTSEGLTVAFAAGSKNTLKVLR